MDRGKEEFLRQLEKAVETMQLGVVITDLDGEILYLNHAEAKMHGYQIVELVAHNVDLLAAPQHRIPPTLEQIKAWKGLVREGVHIRKDGTVFPVWLMSEIVQNAQGEPYGIVTSCEDITERKHAEQELEKHRDHLEEMVAERTAELRVANAQLKCEIDEHKQTAQALQRSEERHRIVLESLPDPVIVYNMEHTVTYVNPAFSRVFGWTLAESKNHSLDFVPDENRSETRTIFEKILHNETVSGIETRRLRKDGKLIDVSISGAGFFDNARILQGSILTIQDITIRKKTEEEIKFLAYHDVLTELPNRKSFYMHLEDAMMHSHFHRKSSERRRSGDHKCALLFLDLDRFKNVNDTLGHDMGDELLKVVVKRLRKCLRKSDYFFRLGGDEFTIILKDFIRNVDVAKVAQKIGEEIARPFYIDSHELYITVSIGISVYPDDGDVVETVVKNADMAMYVAKEEQQGYRFFTEEMHRKALERMKMETSLRNALQQNQFSVFYQPLVGSENQIIGMEALLRWHHPELGLINPTEFIPLAEENGAIVSIGKWVLHTACQQAKKWGDMGHPAFYVSVNLSTRQFKEPDLIEMIEQILEVTGLPPHCLKLEVTESSIMENPENAIAKMKIIRAKGIRFSMDDFGTGYSSLSYLKLFPIDTLKIDRSFVMDALNNKDDQELIKTIIAMAHNLRIDTIAEGVETKDQHDFLLHHGCQFMQGYYHGRPMIAQDFEDLLRAQNTEKEK